MPRPRLKPTGEVAGVAGATASPCLRLQATAETPQVRSPAPGGGIAAAALARQVLMHGLAALRLAGNLACPVLEPPARAAGARLLVTASARPGRMMRPKDDEVRHSARAAG